MGSYGGLRIRAVAAACRDSGWMNASRRWLRTIHPAGSLGNPRKKSGGACTPLRAPVFPPGTRHLKPIYATCKTSICTWRCGLTVAESREQGGWRGVGVGDSRRRSVGVFRQFPCEGLAGFTGANKAKSGLSIEMLNSGG